MDNHTKTKHYNNLKDSIAITLLLGLALVCLILPIALACAGKVSENTNITALIITVSVIFGSACAILIFWIIRYCYGYYVIDDDKVIFHSLYSKKIIQFSEVTNIEVKEEGAFVLGTYKTDVLTIYDNKTKIKIYIDDKNREAILKFADMLGEYIK